MIWSTPALQDATIYEGDQYRNTGLDEILEIKAGFNTDTNDFEEARALIKFDLSDLSSILSSNGITINNVTASLVLHTVQTSELPKDYVLKAYTVGDSWLNGSGYATYPAGIVPSTFESDGVTWNSVAGYGSNTWVSASSVSNTTTLYTSTPGGGDYTGSIASQSFSFKKNDNISMDVTSIVRSWYTGSFTNNGFLIRFNANSADANFQVGVPTIQVYSTETHTVYQPQLYIGWNGRTYSIASATVAAYSDSPVIYPISYRGEYPQGVRGRLMLGARPRYPRKQFTQNTEYANTIALPSSSYYQIKDAHSNEVVVPYSSNTYLSTDASGSYFDFYTTMLYPERFYKFEFKIDYGSNLIEYISSNDFIFKVTNNS